MQYRQGRVGRVVVAKVEHEDDLLQELEKLLMAEDIKAAVIYLLGALKQAAVVVGPEKCVVPPEPVWTGFGDGREVLGLATAFRDLNGQPVIHMHATMGRGEQVMTGCIRRDARVYLVMEIIVMEIADIDVVRKTDEITGLQLLGFI